MGTTGVLVRIFTIAFVSLSPVLASTPRRARAPMPRRIQAAGRDEGLYRRLKWQEARRTSLLLPCKHQRL